MWLQSDSFVDQHVPSAEPEVNFVTSRISPFHVLVRAFRRLPVTFTLVIVSCCLYALSVCVPLFGLESSVDSSRPGALHVMELTEYPSINGMIPLWKGEWWRLTVSAFHHANLLHLLMNVMAFWMFADLLEPRLGKLRYLAFCLLAATFSSLPEAALEHNAVGISGMIFAQFGLILVVRRRDEGIAERMHPSLVPWCFAWLFICIALTLLFGLPIANGAHLMGIVYGAVVGWVCYDLRRRNRPAGYAGLTVIHLGLVACVLALMQPTWNGRYFVWRAITQTKSLDDWKQAVKLDPSLELGWRYIAEQHLESGDRHKAWATVLRGARLNRSSTKLNELARYIWHQFDSAIDRAVALDEVEQIFGDEHDAWVERFELPVPDGVSPTTLAELAFPDLPATTTVGLDDQLDVPASVPGITRPLPAIYPPGTVNPDHPDSASLGTTL